MEIIAWASSLCSHWGLEKLWGRAESVHEVEAFHGRAMRLRDDDSAHPLFFVVALKCLTCLGPKRSSLSRGERACAAGMKSQEAVTVKAAP